MSKKEKGTLTKALQTNPTVIKIKYVLVAESTFLKEWLQLTVLFLSTNLKE